VRPTYLYIKQHKETGLLYFGKTVQDPVKYKGSGKYWKNHIKEHGNNIETLWYCLFLDKETLTETATLLSTMYNIVTAVNENKRKVWANEKPETGLDGGNMKGVNKGIKRSAETKALISKIRTGTKQSAETIAKKSASLKDRTFSEEHLEKLRKPKPPRTAEHSRNASKARKDVPWSEARRLAQRNRNFLQIKEN
jgi:uncharacterized protein YdbL (DUF1318 family)